MRASDPSVVLPPVRYWCQYGIQCVARNARAFPRVGFHLIHGAGWSMAAGGAVEGRASAYRPCGAWRAVSSCRVDRRRALQPSGTPSCGNRLYNLLARSMLTGGCDGRLKRDSSRRLQPRCTYIPAHPPSTPLLFHTPLPIRHRLCGSSTASHRSRLMSRRAWRA